MPEFILPDWPAPAGVRALATTRGGGASAPPWQGFNLGDHVGDDPHAVAANRALLRRELPAEPVWLSQVHGTRCVDAATARPGEQADASFSRSRGVVCTVLTADCLPVLFCDDAGSVVAAAHAGWRGLASGVLEETVKAMNVDPGRILAWLGPAIGPDSFEVGPEVREAFVARHPMAGIAFRPAFPGTLDETPRKWLADIYMLARIRLAAIGVERVHGGGACTFKDSRRFFSYRRDGRTGRMASLIWFE